jgi:RHS repeat-associated protein
MHMNMAKPSRFLSNIAKKCLTALGLVKHSCTWGVRRNTAADAFDRILATQKPGTDIWQKAKLRRAGLHFARGELTKAQTCFLEMLKTEKTWERKTYGHTMLNAIKRARSQLASLRVCGKESIAYILRHRGDVSLADKAAVGEAPSENGFTLGELNDLAKSFGLDAKAIFGEANSVDDLPTPFIAHYKDQHFVVVSQVNDSGGISIYDPRLRAHTMLNDNAFFEQWSGFAILVSDTLPTGVRLADAFELNDQVGGCCGYPPYPEDLGKKCKKKKCKGLPEWEVNPVNMNFVISDIPIWHDSAYGPDFELELVYNSQESLSPLRIFGAKWSCNYTSTAVEAPGGGKVTVVMPDGRGDEYSPNGVDGYTAPLGTVNQLTKIAPYTFDLTEPDGTVYRYGVPPALNGTTSMLLSIKDKNGHFLTITHDGNGLIDYVTDPQGNVFNFSYDRYGQVTQVSDPWGRSATFSYEDGELLGQKDMGGLSYGYNYEDNGAGYINEIRKPTGSCLIKIEPPDGIEPSNGTGTGYPGPGETMWEAYRITITDPMGYQEEYHCPSTSSARVVWHRDKVQYRSGLNSVDGPRTEYGFSLVGGAAGKGVISQIEYANGNRIQFINFDPQTLLVTEMRNERGYYVDLTYNSKGQIQTISRPHTSTQSQVPTTTYGYASNGYDVTTITDRLNRLAFEFVYYPNSRLVQKIRETQKPGTVRETQYTYDSLNRIETVINPASQLYTYEYYPGTDLVAGQRYRLKAVHLGSLSGPIVQSFTYNARGLVQTETNEDGWSKTYSYDDLDRITAVAYPDGTSERFQRGCCVLESYTNRLGQSTDYLYDSLNRLVWERDARGVVTQYRYDPNGNLVKLIDGNSNVTRWTYDERQRVKTKVYSDGKEWVYGYDEEGNVTSIKDGKNILRSFRYDIAGNPERASGAGRVVNYVYDTLDQLESVTENGQLTTFGYNVAGELTSENGPLANDTIEYDYNLLGQRSSRTVNGVSRQDNYDSQGRLMTIANVLGSFTNNYISGISRRLDVTTTSTGMSTAFGYHSAQNEFRLASIWHKTSGGATAEKYDYEYDSVGQITGWTITPFNASSQRWEIAHDPVGQIQSAIRRNTTTQALASSRGYTYDGAKNRRSSIIDSTIAAENVNSLNQLTSRGSGVQMPVRGSTNEPVQSVTVNGVPATIKGGNSFEGTVAISGGTQQVSIAATDFGLPPNTSTRQFNITTAGVAPQTYQYDDNGNLLADGETTYEWDGWDRLTAVVKSNRRTEIAYDALDRRNQIIEMENGIVLNTRRYVWASSELVEERTEDGSVVTRRWEREGEQQFAPGGNLLGSYLYGRDHLGSVRVLCNGSGVVQTRYDYDIWGNRVEIGGTPPPRSGNLALNVYSASGVDQVYFYGASATLSIGQGDKLCAWVFVDPSAPPRTIMLQWLDQNGSWDHRAYWGENLMPWGTDGTASRRNLGPLPNKGEWVKLEVPASSVGLEGATIQGMAFSIYDGHAAWDRAAKIPSNGSELIWMEDSVPNGALVGGAWLWSDGGPETASGYTGHYYHFPSNLNLALYRSYSPLLGRWLSRDPIAENGGINLYGYVANSPINAIDPLGLQTTVQTPSGVAVLAELVKSGAMTADEALALAGSAAAAAALNQALHQQGLIDHLDEHLRKMGTTCPTGSPDPNDPDHDPVKGWIKEIKAAIKNLKQELKKMPKNKEKRKPVEEAIKRGEDAVNCWGQ